MANKYYQPGAGRAAGVEDLFAAVAPRYDLINDLQSGGLHRLWKRRLVRLAAPRPGQPALDLCCGTGDVAFALARAGAEVTGCDFSRPMLDVADRRAAARPVVGPGSVRFVQGDALNLPLADGSFDVVTVSYGLRNLADGARGIREMARVLRPGGRLVVLDFGKPDNRAWRAVYFAYLRHLVPVFGRLFCGDADTHWYILESLEAYPAQRGVDRWMADAGLEGRRIVNLLGGMMSLNVGMRPRGASEEARGEGRGAKG